MNQPPRLCSHCGAQLGAASRFCPRCGNPVTLPRPTPGFQETPTGQPMPTPAQPTPTPIPPTQYTPVPTELPAQPFPPPPRRNYAKIIIIAVVVLTTLSLICCLLVGAFYIYPKYIQTTKTPKKTSTSTGTITPSISGIASNTLIPNRPFSSVNFEGVSFSYDPSLATGFTNEIVPAFTTPGAASWELAPQYRLFQFIGYPRANEFHVLPQIAVFPAAEYTSVSADAGKQISSLRDFLRRKPATLGEAEEIPFLPIQNAGQVLQASIQYLAFKNGDGVRFLTQYHQDVYPINNADLFYTFQGLSTDGRFYISMRLPVSNPALDGQENQTVDQAFIDNYSSYIVDIQGKLEAQPGSSFKPELSLLDAIVFSLFVE